METFKQLLKDYGPAVGPALAFLFGLAAILAKDRFDRWNTRRSLSRRLQELALQISRSGPPEDFFPRSGPNGFHADVLRNATNLARFYTRLLALKPVFDKLASTVAEIGTTEEITKLHAMKWWFDIVLDKVEACRKNQKFQLSEQQLQHLQDYWKSLRQAAVDPEDDLRYIANRPHDEKEPIP
jgi:hypothetical protein